MLNRFTDCWLNWVIHHPKTVLSLVVGLLVVAIAGLPNFKLDASADSLTLEHDEDLGFFREVSKNFGSGDFLVVTFTPHDDLFSDASLDLLQRLQQDLAEIDGIVGINSILNVPLLYSPKVGLRDIAREPRTLLTPDVDRAMAKQEFLTSPIYRDLILGPDGKTTALQLNIAVDHRYIELVQRRDALRLRRDTQGLTADEQTELREVSRTFLDYRTASEARAHQRVEEVRQVVAQYQDQAQIFVGGVTMIAADMITFIKKDLVVFGAAVLLFMIAVLTAIFRNLRFVVIPMFTCLTAVVLMLGLVSWLDWRLTVISSNFVALLLIVSLAIIIHLVVRYREFAQENPDWTQQQLVEATVRFMAKPCLYTSLTTIVAFTSLVVSDIRPVIDFGWMMTIGLVFALILAFVVLPASMMLLPRDPATASDGTRASGKPLTLYCSAFVERHGLWVVLLAAVMVIVSATGISRLQVENRFIDYFHEDTEIYQGLSVIDNQLGGTTTLDIIMGAAASPAYIPVEENASFDGEDPFAEGDAFAENDAFADDGDPFADDQAEDQRGGDFWMTVAGLQQVERIHDYLESLPEVGKVQSLAILYKVGKDINGSLNNFELAVMQRALTDEVRDVLTAPFLSGDDTRITMRVKDSYPGLKRAELMERIRMELDQEFHLDMDHVRFSGLLVLYNNMLQSLFGSQIVTLGVVFLGITLMFVVLFRSVYVAILAILPNILAALTILGAMGLLSIPLDMMTITVAAIAVGIGVDNTIHYIYRFRREVAKDGDYIAAMHRSHGSIGRAMYYTSVIIIFGFSIMVLSAFIPTIYFGLLTAMAMFAALLGALLLLPKLILLARPFKALPADR